MAFQLDTSIPLGARSFSLGNTFADAFQQGSQMRFQRDAQQAAIEERRAQTEELTRKTNEARRQQFEEQTLATLFGSGQPVDPKAVYSVVGPKRGADILKGISALQEQDIKTEAARKAQVDGIVGGLLSLPPGQLRQNGYARARTKFIQEGIVQPEDMPEEYSDDYAKAARKWATTPKEQLDQEAQAARDKIAADSAAAQLPGQVADAAMKQQVAAGMRGGLTPEQQATQQNARGQLAVSQGNLAVSRQREAREAATANQFGAVGSGAAPTAPTGTGLNPDALAKMAPPIQTTVKALAEGRMAFPTGAALRSDYWQHMLQAVGEYDPSFDAVNYNARSQTRKAFTSGKEAAQVNALNTVVGHLDSLGAAADKLHNSFSPTLNTVTNVLKNAVGRPEVKQFDATQNAVVDELTRVWRQSGGTEQDIKSWAASLGNANSPKQIHGVIGQIAELLESKLSSLQDQNRQGMGTAAIDVITPGARATLDKLKSTSGSVPGVEEWVRDPKTGRLVRKGGG